jgi:tetratricopeptide repeat protein
MKSGRRPLDESFINRLFDEAGKSASANESAAKQYDAYIGYSQIVSDFKGLKDVAEFERKAALLKESKLVRQAINRERDQENEELRRMKELFSLRAKLRTRATAAALGEGGAYGAVNSHPYEPANDPQTRQPLVNDLKRILADLKRKSDSKENSTERALARRVLNQFTVTLFEQARSLIEIKKYDLAVSNLETDAEIMPDSWRVLYNLACAYVLNGDKRRAIESLNKAVEKGFVNATELETNHQLDAIRGEAGFKKIVEGLKQKQ